MIILALSYFSKLFTWQNQLYLKNINKFVYEIFVFAWVWPSLSLSGLLIACQVRVTRSNRWPGFQLERPGMQRWWRHKTCWPFAENNNPVFISSNSVLSQKRRPLDQGLWWGNSERREKGKFLAVFSTVHVVREMLVVGLAPCWMG